MGSPELFKKYTENQGNVVSQEIRFIHRRFQENPKDILPVLIDGNFMYAFPEYLTQSVVYTDMRLQDQYYFKFWEILDKLIEDVDLKESTRQVKNEFLKNYQYIRQKLPDQTMEQIYSIEQRAQLSQDEKTQNNINNNYINYVINSNSNILGDFISDTNR